MPRLNRNRPKTALVLFALLSFVVVLSSCGSSSDTAASELVKQRELSAARHQAAEDARQTVRIKELEHKLKHVHQGERAFKSEAAAAPSSPPSTTSSRLGDWPGGTGYTAILASVASQAEARSIQQEASAKGLDAGVLYSSNFSSLRSGYWVVFSGSFAEEGEADSRASRAEELGYTEAYPRFVAP